MNREKKEFKELKLPESLGEIKVNDIRRAIEEKELSLEEYTDLAYKWAQSAWNSWSGHHQAIRNLVEKYNKILKK